MKKSVEKKFVKKGKAKWKRMLDELKEQTIIFYDNHETIDEETKWMIEFIVRNFEKFIRRNKSQYACFDFSISNYIDNELFSSTYKTFMNELIDLNAEVLKKELKNSLTDGVYRFPRCPHFESEVKHVLEVLACHYLEETDKEYLKFFICNDCKDYIDFCVKMRKFIGLREDFGRNFREIKL